MPPLVGDADRHIFSGREGKGGGFGHFDIFGPDLNQAPRRHGLDGVNEQIAEHLMHLPPVHLHLPEALRQGELDPGPGAADGQFAGLLDQFFQVLGFFEGTAALGKGQEVLGQGLALPAGGLGRGQARFDLRDG